jgi:DNA-directed RNA polymerase alpha subunit
MTVDVRLSQMMLADDKRLTSIPISALEFSVRTLDGLRKVGATNLGEAYWSVLNRTLRRQRNIGPKSIKEVEDMVAYVLATRPVVPSTARERKLEQTLEMFLRWTGALAVCGDITRDAWCELVDMRAEAARILGHE